MLPLAGFKPYGLLQSCVPNVMYQFNRSIATNSNNNASNISSQSIDYQNLSNDPQYQLSSTKQKKIHLQQQLQLLQSIQNNELNQQRYFNSKSMNIFKRLGLVFLALFSLTSTYKLWLNKNAHHTKLNELNQLIDEVQHQTHSNMNTHNSILQQYSEITDDIICHYMNSATNKNDVDLYNALQQIKLQIQQQQQQQQQQQHSNSTI